MTSSQTPDGLDVPARHIPVPAHLSPAAQSALNTSLFDREGDYPALDDLDVWRAMIVEQDAEMLSLVSGFAGQVSAEVEDIQLDGFTVYAVTPEGTAPDDRRVYLDIHGGGLILGGGDSCRAMAALGVSRIGARTWAVDYRMPPDHPYPTPLDDCVSAYRSLLEDHAPEDIIVGGTSAGGNLAAALVLRARDEGLPMPAAAVLLTPEVDLTESGDSFATNLGIDTILTKSLMPANLLYADGHDLADPYLSPLFGDFTRGFPPTFLATGTRDLFLSNTVRMHRSLRAADIPAELHVLEAAPHGWFFGMAPEDAELAGEVRRFVDAHWQE